MRQAVIDIGTNTCLLVIADSEIAGSMRVISDVHAIARLGAGVDATKMIREESYERLKTILSSHQWIIQQSKVDSVCAIATSAMRDAANRAEIINKTAQDTEFQIEILSGDDESYWSYRGALCGLSGNDLVGEIAALDIGGGSTELSLGENGTYLGGNSINIGAVRIRERFLSVMDDASIDAARSFIRQELTHTIPIPHSKKLIAVAGTPNALAAMKLGLIVFDSEKVNSTILTKDVVSELTRELLKLSANELIEKYPAIHPDRADILPSGALILEETMRHLKLNEVQVSTFGLRFGILIREFEKVGESPSPAWDVKR